MNPDKECIGRDSFFFSYSFSYSSTILFFFLQFCNFEGKETKRMTHIKFRIFVLGREADRMREST